MFFVIYGFRYYYVVDAQNLPASGAGDDNTHLSERSGYNGQELMSVTKFLRNLASDVQSKLSGMYSDLLNIFFPSNSFTVVFKTYLFPGRLFPLV